MARTVATAAKMIAGGAALGFLGALVVTGKSCPEATGSFQPSTSVSWLGERAGGMIDAALTTGRRRETQPISVFFASQDTVIPIGDTPFAPGDTPYWERMGSGHMTAYLPQHVKADFLLYSNEDDDTKPETVRECSVWHQSSPTSQSGVYAPGIGPCFFSNRGCLVPIANRDGSIDGTSTGLLVTALKGNWKFGSGTIDCSGPQVQVS